MSDISTASTYTGNDEHLRTVIPVSVVRKSHIKPGAALKWSSLDDCSFVVKVVA